VVSFPRVFPPKATSSTTKIYMQWLEIELGAQRSHCGDCPPGPCHGLHCFTSHRSHVDTHTNTHTHTLIHTHTHTYTHTHPHTHTHTYIYITNLSHKVGPIASSVGIATELPGWTFRGSYPGGGEIFRTCADRSWGPPSLL